MLSNTKIKNIVFDVGNVLIQWEPYEVIGSVFPSLNPQDFFQAMYPIWIDLNLGKVTLEEAIKRYSVEFRIPENQISTLMDELKKAQIPIPGSIELLKKLQALGVNLYSITDNIKELFEYHRIHSEFPRYFKDIIVSADLGILKPDIRIYQHLLNKHRLIPSESVFFDDLVGNVNGAINAGMLAFQFTNVIECEKELIKLGLPLL